MTWLTDRCRSGWGGSESKADTPERWIIQRGILECEERHKFTSRSLRHAEVWTLFCWWLAHVKINTNHREPRGHEGKIQTWHDRARAVKALYPVLSGTPSLFCWEFILQLTKSVPYVQWSYGPALLGTTYVWKIKCFCQTGAGECVRSWLKERKGKKGKKR